RRAVLKTPAAARARTAVLIGTYATVAGGVGGILVGYWRISHTSLMKDAVLFYSSARTMIASGLVVLAATIVLHVVRQRALRGSSRPPDPDGPWRHNLGAIEGVFSLACLLYILNSRVQPGTRYLVPWDMLIIWALGTGLGVGALRFGGPVARWMGGIAVGVLGTFLGILLVFGVNI